MSFRRPGIRRRADLHHARMTLRAASVNGAGVAVSPPAARRRDGARYEYRTAFTAINSGGRERKASARTGVPPATGSQRRDRPMSVKMPAPDHERARAPRRHRAGAARDRAGRGRDRDRAEMRPYESDALTAYRQLPHGGGAARYGRAGVRACCATATPQGIKVVPRGAGTSLSGGALPARRRRPARHGQVQPHPRDRPGQPRGGGASPA